MSYNRRKRTGLMGLGAVGDDQAPVEVGARAQTSPILSTASVLASEIMLKMAAVPRGQRLGKMVSILNGGQHGLGDSAKADFIRRAAAMGPSKKDQAMFDAIRAALADALTEKVLKQAGRLGSLGQTIAEARGATSQGVNDANALFCSYGAGIGAMVGGFSAQFGSNTTATAGAGMTGATTAGQIAGCGAGQLVIQGQVAAQQAQIAQSGAAQTLAMQQAADARFMRNVIIGGGVIGVLGIGYMVAKK